MLSEAKIVECLQSADCTGVVRMSFESGPYCIDRPTIKASRFAEQIESAATAPLLARIAELDRSLDVIAQNTEAQAHASLQREIELTEKVEKLTRELEEARKDAERYLCLVRLFGVTKLPCLLEPVVGDYVADGKESLDAAIDAVRAAIKEQT